MKLNKMYKNIHCDEVKQLMNLIETQSTYTLASWGLNYVKEHYLPYYKEDSTLLELIPSIENWICHPKEKVNLKEARSKAGTIKDIVELSSYRAVITAFAITSTPTNTLGFLFYGANMYAYSTGGLKITDEQYDKLCKEELAAAYQSLKKVSIENESNKAKIKWGC